MANGSKNRCPELSSEAPNKRFKTQNLENSPPRPPSPSQLGSLLSSMKGKSKLDTETESNVCGICLSEAVQDGNNASRGYIDSCDHYFCFVCIMEWAKVESKCPHCKRRFSTIRRPSKPPLFPCERLVRVPVRDQVHYHFGNASTGPLDLYSDVECIVCHSSADESFLLLCDLCDSASHTHCVGLGATVPEGDWFCRDCTLLRAEHSQSELDTESSELSNSGNLNGSSKNITVFDNVRNPESPIRRVERSSTSNLSEDRIVKDTRGQAMRAEHSHSELDTESSELSNSGNLNSSSKNITVFDIVRNPESPIRRVERSATSNLSEDRIVKDTRGQASNVQDSSRLSARTLRQRRNVHGCIQALRDNWNSFRSGSLNFSLSSNSSTNQTCEVASNSAQPHSKSSLRERLNSENGPQVPTENRSNRIIHEIDKAWKMMDIAKSMEQKRGRKSILNQASKTPLSSKHLSINDQQLGSVNLACIRQEKQASDHSLVNNSNKHKTQILEKRSLSVQGFQNCSTGFSISSSPVDCKLTSPQDTRSPLQYDFCNENGRNLPKKSAAVRVPSATSNDCSKSVSLGSLVGSTPVASNLSHAKLKLPASSSCKIESSKPKDTKEKSPVDVKNKGNNDAKSEIQSLVKLNLKLLAKDKHLGVNAFKEVARSATHSILAACGLEHPKPGIHQFPSSVCRHSSDGLDIRRSTLMPNSCRECFYVFVKDVVSTIMLEKIQSADAS